MKIKIDHLDVKVDIVIDAMAKLFEMITGKTPRSRVRLSSPPRPHPPKTDHLDVKVDIVIDAMAKLFEMITGKTPRFLGKALKFPPLPPHPRKHQKRGKADHLDVKVDIVIDAMAKLFEMITGKTPRFRARLLQQLLSD